MNNDNHNQADRINNNVPLYSFGLIPTIITSWIGFIFVCFIGYYNLKKSFLRLAKVFLLLIHIRLLINVINSRT
jgi:hypothetical protein